MAPKHPEMIKEPPLVSSSEEDEEESGSSAEESDSSGEDSKKDDSSDDEADVPSKPTPKIAAPVALKKPESDSEGESDSDSDPEPAKKKQPQNSVLIKHKAESSGSAVTLPESSTAKRPLKQGEENEAKKKMKTEEVKKISGEEAKKMFQRLFSEEDEIALLQGILDFTGDISEDMDAFCSYVKKLINFNATRSQIATKIQRLKKKFVNILKKSLKKGKGEDQVKFSKDVDQKAFDLSRKIWGNDGLLASKSRKKIGGTPKEIKIKLAHSPKKQEESEKPKAIVVNTDLSSSREIALFLKAGNPNVFSWDESAFSAGWDSIADGPKKREMEEKLKKLKTRQVELCLQRASLVNIVAKMMFEDNASSSC